MIHEIVDEAAASRPDAVALRDRDGAWTYRQLVECSRAVEAWLASQHVRSGDRVVMCAVAARMTVALLYGCSRLGVTFVPLSAAMPRRQVCQILDDARPRLFVADDWSAAATHTKVATLKSSDVSAMVEATTGAATQGCAPPPAAGPALLVYTSGSTGSPRGVVCSHASVEFAARAIATRLRYRPDDVVYCRLPLSFDYGLYQIFLCGLAGAELFLAGPGADSSLLVEIRRCGATVVPLVPSLACMVLQLASRDQAATRIRMFTNTGEELPQPVIGRLRHRFPGAHVHVMFGTTECKRISIMEADGDVARPGSVGRPLDGTEVVIVDEEGAPVPLGTTGEIVVRGPHVMTGYWRSPELTRQVFRRTGRSSEVLLHTGDYGHLDGAGYLYFHGRKDDTFKRNGMRTSVREIEAAAQDVPGVTEAAVLPPAAGRDAVLVVAGSITPGELLRQMRDRLEGAKIPSICRVVDCLPHGPNGKRDRALIAELVDGADP